VNKKTSSPQSGKREHLRAERRRKNWLWNGILLGGVGLVGLILLVSFLASLRPGALPGELEIADEGRGHAEAGTNLTFRSEPPSSGTHYAEAAPWGLATAPVPPGNYLHNLALGGTVILYHCATPCPDLERQLSDFYAHLQPDTNSKQAKILITAYEKDLPTPLVALAWGHQLNLQQFDAAVLRRWHKRFVDLGPEAAP
jgi:hypothetical protein